MGIAGVEPRQLAPTVGTTGSGSAGSLVTFNDIQIASGLNRQKLARRDQFHRQQRIYGG
jgi:hypothetical protein